ncbi:MAG: 3-hydroxyacyl-CoA dehydrogenase NAD-binding [Bradyrhizobium sp.]|nr:3-hydroxyacyl-CoA dehydrogenase NAD-binding [Bradyrhizobium sp.]
MTAINAVTDLSVIDGIAVITLNAPPVNALSAKVRVGLFDAFGQAGGDPEVKAIILMCEGRTFIAGADISEFGKPMIGPSIREVQDVIENCPKPVIAAIHGTALGGGLEIALVAHYRVAVPSAKAGLPEVNIGLVPGAGGTQRLPRIVGVETALDLVTSGRHVPAADAVKLGLFDALVAEDSLREGATAFARKVVAQGGPLTRICDNNSKLDVARGKPEIFTAFRQTNARRFRGFDAPDANIQAIEAAVNEPFEQALETERQLFRNLMAGTQSGAQRHAFFAERQAAKIPDVPAETPTRPIRRIGVIGAGTMGGGIAMNFLTVGLPVTLVETERAALDRGLDTIRKNYENSAKKGKLSQDLVESRMRLLTPSLSLGDLNDCDLIIEAVFENMALKKEVFATLDGIAKAGAILASNTSYLDIDEIASATSRGQDVVGLHFFSPANVMTLLEVVRGTATGTDVIATAMKLGKLIRKVPVLVGNGNGFVGNRMLAARQREVQKLLLEGAKLEDIDRIIYDFGMPMGPFAMNDMAGIDLGVDLRSGPSNSVREVLCKMGRRGQKTGAGYYDYDEARNPTPSALVQKVVRDFAAERGIAQRTVSDEEIFERCLYPMIDEGAKILEEGIALRASDIDVVWIKGYGWPVYRGGPMYWAGLVGLDTILARLKDLQAQHGDDFKPSPLLERLAGEGKGFN